MKKIHMVCDFSLLITMIVLVVLSTIMTTWTMFAVVHEGTVKDLSELLLIRIFLGALLGGLVIAIVASAPRFLCTITLSEAAIDVWVPFCKKETFSYKQFRYVYYGGYFHGNIAGIGRTVWYIVIAQRHLSSNELNQINLIPNSKEVVKIRYTRRTYKKLLMFLPSSHVRQLESAMAKVQDK